MISKNLKKKLLFITVLLCSILFTGTYFNTTQAKAEVIDAILVEHKAEEVSSVESDSKTGDEAEALEETKDKNSNEEEDNGTITNTMAAVVAVLLITSGAGLIKKRKTSK